MLGKYIQSLTKEELLDIQDKINPTDEELEIIGYLKKGWCIDRIAMEMLVSTSSIKRRIKNITQKIKKVVI